MIHRDYPLFASVTVVLKFISGTSVNQWINKYGWKDMSGQVFISNQEENIKTKNITEKITFDSMYLSILIYKEILL